MFSVVIGTFLNDFDFFYIGHNRYILCVRFFLGEKKYLLDFKIYNNINFTNDSAEGMNIA
jgi:hypothetical protein